MKFKDAPEEHISKGQPRTIADVDEPELIEPYAEGLQDTGALREPAEMNQPEEDEAGERAIMEEAGEGLSHDAVDFLLDGHGRIIEMFGESETESGLPDADARLIKEQLCSELEVLLELEEEIFFPRVYPAADDDGKQFIEDSRPAYEHMRNLLRDVRSLDMASLENEEAFHELQLAVTEQFDQEDNMLLPMAHENLGNELVDIGHDMLERKQQIETQGGGLSPTSASNEVTRSMGDNAPEDI